MRLFALLVLKCILHCSRFFFLMSNLARPRFHSQKHRYSIRVWEISFHPSLNQNLTFNPLFGQDVGSGERLAGRDPNTYIQSLVSVKSENRWSFSLQKANLLVRKVLYLHTKFSFSMSIFLWDSQTFSVTCGCVQKLNIYKIDLENLRFSSPVIEFFCPCSHVAANFFSLWKKASIIWCKTHIFSLGD